MAAVFVFLDELSKAKCETKKFNKIFTKRSFFILARSFSPSPIT